MSTTPCQHQVQKTVVIAAGKTSTLTMTCPFDAVPGTAYCPRHQPRG